VTHDGAPVDFFQPVDGGETAARNRHGLLDHLLAVSGDGRGIDVGGIRHPSEQAADLPRQRGAGGGGRHRAAQRGVLLRQRIDRAMKNVEPAPRLDADGEMQRAAVGGVRAMGAGLQAPARATGPPCQLRRQ
jgi:hypothetical protein